MSKLVYSPMALEDLQHLYEYIVTSWGEKVAKKIMKIEASED